MKPLRCEKCKTVTEKSPHYESRVGRRNIKCDGKLVPYERRRAAPGVVEALEYVRDMILQIPGGINEEAREDDMSPEDVAQHIGGLIYQRVIAALRATGEAKP